MNDAPKILEPPELWVQCDCGTAYVFRRCLSFSQGWTWVWQADCKHPKKEGHEPVMMTADGVYTPEGQS